MEVVIRKRTPGVFAGSEACGNCEGCSESCGESCGESCACTSSSSSNLETASRRHVLSAFADIDSES